MNEGINKDELLESRIRPYKILKGLCYLGTAIGVTLVLILFFINNYYVSCVALAIWIISILLDEFYKEIKAEKVLSIDRSYPEAKWNDNTTIDSARNNNRRLIVRVIWLIIRIAAFIYLWKSIYYDRHIESSGNSNGTVMNKPVSIYEVIGENKSKEILNNDVVLVSDSITVINFDSNIISFDLGVNSAFVGANVFDKNILGIRQTKHFDTTSLFVLTQGDVLFFKIAPAPARSGAIVYTAIGSKEPPTLPDTLYNNNSLSLDHTSAVVIVSQEPILSVEDTLDAISHVYPDNGKLMVLLKWREDKQHIKTTNLKLTLEKGSKYYNVKQQKPEVLYKELK